jgi:hypothetical protein
MSTFRKEVYPEVPLDPLQLPFLAARTGIALMERLKHKYLPYCVGWVDEKAAFSFLPLLGTALLGFRFWKPKTEPPF